jgi:hypothetical protein
MPTLNQFLTYKHIRNGIELTESEDTLILHCGSEFIALYGIYVDREQIVKDADEYLNRREQSK